MNLTFLDAKQVFGDEKLEIIDKRGAYASVTDFSILLGCTYTQESNCGMYWTKDNISHSVYSVFLDGDRHLANVWNYRLCCRPVLSYLDSSNFLYEKLKRHEDGILEVEYGLYPQTAANVDMQEALNVAFSSGLMVKTGNIYTIYKKAKTEYQDRVMTQLIEYEFDNKRYVRVEVEREVPVLLLHGGVYRNGDFVWIEVQPVKWWVDEKAKILVSEKLIFSGVEFDGFRKATVHMDFEKTDIKKFLDDYLVKEMFQNQKKIGNSNLYELNLFHSYDVLRKKVKTMTEKEKYEFVILFSRIEIDEIESARYFLQSLDSDWVFIFDNVCCKDKEKKKIIKALKK